MSDAERNEDEGDSVSLVRLAGPRPAPSAEHAAAARAQVHAAWRAGLRRRRARAALLVAAGLAVLAVGTLAGRYPWQSPATVSGPAAPASVVARLDAATAIVDREGGSGWTRLVVGETLSAGGRVRAVVGGAGFLTADGRSVRLAPESRVRWDASQRLTLEAGSVYVDSGPAARARTDTEVHTPWGVVRETGTQFEVRLDTQGLRVRVREGRVNAGGEDAASGTELRLDGHGVTRRAVAVHGPEWAWVLSVAPGFEMDGRTLGELASWAAREAGWELRYADAGSEARARAAVLHGSIRGLRPDEAALAVIPSTGLSHRLSDGVLRIGPDDPQGRR